ncbi:MAG TPA: DNA primase, partial [Stackebrandtia sp.]
MAGRIRAADVALVRERVSIAEVIGEHVTLKSAGGGNLKGLCPFHDERTPSFNVTPSRGFWYCFGCSAGGDAITFLTQLEHLSFAEAVEQLASKAGVTLHYETADGKTQSAAAAPGQKQRLLEAHAEAAKFYSEQLAEPTARVARDFLTERGFDRAAAETYGCGYAPDSWDALTKHLRRKGFTPDELTVGGLSKPARSGSLIDRFRNRLLWPIRDVGGNVIGFGARRLAEDDTGPKYLNTPETPLYKKSHVLYGIDLAKREIAKASKVVVVEGYTDVMACHLAGVPWAVATCGTAFGEGHIQVVRRLMMDINSSGEIVFTFDGDEAGQRAALKAFESDQSFSASTYVAVTPGGMDPCELRIASGDAAVRDVIDGRHPLVEFAIESMIAKFDLDSMQGRIKALNAIAPSVARVGDGQLRTEIIRDVSNRLGEEREVVQQAVRAAARRESAPRQAPRTRRRPDGPYQLRQREALKLALQWPDLSGPYFDAVDDSFYRDELYRAVRVAITAAGGARAAGSGPNWLAAVTDACGDMAAAAMISELAVEPLRVTADPDAS